MNIKLYIKNKIKNYLSNLDLDKLSSRNINLIILYFKKFELDLYKKTIKETFKESQKSHIYDNSIFLVYSNRGWGYTEFSGKYKIKGTASEAMNAMIKEKEINGNTYLGFIPINRRSFIKNKGLLRKLIKSII